MIGYTWKLFRLNEIGQGLILRFGSYVHGCQMTSLVLEISSMKKAIYLPILMCPISPGRLMLDVGNIKTIELLEGRCFSYLRLSWPTLYVVTPGLKRDVVFQLTTQIRIPIFRGCLCKAIVGESHVCRLLASHQCIYSEIFHFDRSVEDMGRRVSI